MIRALFTALLLGLTALPALAQIPEKFENLEVLPKDISRAQLVNVMRGFTSALGVRCQYCHAVKAGASPDDLNNFDFAAEDKEEKKQARVMMRMVSAINDTLLPRLPTRAEPQVHVGCVTCHRGSPLPRTLDAVLAQTIEAEGVDSAVAQYRQLRETALSLGRYNFGEVTLTELARQLMANNNAVAAIRMLELNQEFYPQSAAIDYQLGEIYRARGERERAIDRYQKALTKMPNHAQAKQRLQELQ